MKSMFAQAKEMMGVEPKPVVAGHTFVFVWYERAKHRVFMDVGATASAFEMNTYLATGVMPTRQKLVGFDGKRMRACVDCGARCRAAWCIPSEFGEGASW